ncbi:hypothetical protein DH2020_039123 [Rehmannia glutinosa]|uniref:ELMO domain-containing protein n=1 Tax=Rehmannia glutinosa TaxID=99300 RepID=A0ABR0UXZ1_REHGL
MSRTATLVFVVLTGFAFWSYISDVSSTIKSYDPNSPLFSGGVVHANGSVVGGLKEEGHRRVGENLEIPFLMSSRTLRRRLHHKDVDGGRYDRYETSQFDSLNEPLLGNSDYDYNKHSEGQALADILDDERSKERLHWTLLFSNVIAQWAQCKYCSWIWVTFWANFAIYPGAQNGANSNLRPVLLSPLQEAFQNLLHKRDGDRSEWEYPFAVAGINISFMLVQMLDLQSGNPNTLAGHRFLELLSQDEMAFDNLFCVAFKMLDAQWLAKRASYMEFNDVLKSTRSQLEREMALEDVSSVRDLPAFNLLKS